jgi:hypothetical protein
VCKEHAFPRMLLPAPAGTMEKHRPLSDSAYTQPAIGVIHAMSAPTASLRMAIGQIEFTMRRAADG